MRVVFAEGSDARAYSPAELDSIISRIDTSVAKPLIITVECHSAQLTVGLSSAGCFVQVAPLAGNPPYFVTVGDPAAAGVATFFLHGTHHTEIPRRHLISSAEARLVVSEFAARGSRSNRVSWEEA